MEGIMGNWMKNEIPSFAKGLHVLVVDHDGDSLQSLASMLQFYSYKVTTTELANDALTMISEAKEDEPFNLVMVNISIIPDLSILSFLHSLLQMEIPIILMFSKIDMNMASKAIADLGCHFLEKPISMEDIELVWQYVYRKNRNPNTKKFSSKENHVNDGKLEVMIKEAETSQVCGILTENGMKQKDGSINGYMGSNPCQNGKIVDEMDKKNDKNGSVTKRSRIVWGSKLHRKFTGALSKLGNKKSSPKIILKMMNEPTLTLRQVASHLQKYKTQVKHLNKTASIIPAENHDKSSSLKRIQFQHLLRKQNYTTPIQALGQPNYSSNYCDGPKLPLGNIVTCDHRMMNQNFSNPYPNYLQPATYGRSDCTNLGDENRSFAHDFNMEYKSSECFIQTSKSNLQYLREDVDHHFLPADYQCLEAIQELEFAPNYLGGCLCSQSLNHHVVESGGKADEFWRISGKISRYDSMDVHNLVDGTDENLKLNIASGVHRQPDDYLNQNAALKELDDLLNNGEDPTGYFCFDSEPNPFEIDRYNEWLNT